jgi:hypothetical protein
MLLFFFLSVKRKLTSYKCCCKKISCPTCPECRWKAKGKQYPKAACPFNCETCSCLCDKKFNSGDIHKSKATLSPAKLTTQSSNNNQYGFAADMAKEVLHTISIDSFFLLKTLALLLKLSFIYFRSGCIYSSATESRCKVIRFF